MCMCTCIYIWNVLISGVDVAVADSDDVHVVVADSDDVHVGVAESDDVAVADSIESDGGDLVEAGLLNSITNLSLGCIQHVHVHACSQQ